MPAILHVCITCRGSKLGRGAAQREVQPQDNATRPGAQLLAAIEKSGLPDDCLLYTSPSPRDKRQSRMPSSA